MTKNDFRKMTAEKIIFLDGATGTELQKKGLPKGVCPEKWVHDNPEAIISLHKAYQEAGSDAVFACTFGCNRLKLEEFDLQDDLQSLNMDLVQISKKALGNKTLVIGDMSPTGQFVEPFGSLSFDDAVAVYKEQALALAQGGADLLIIETMIDIQETRAALIAAKEACDLPVLVSLTFSEDKVTLTGTSPLAALITLQSLGADAFGCNCSTGPGTMLEIIKEIKPYATIPLFAKPNAGLPQLKDGKTVFPMNPDDFASYIPQFIEAGVNLFGGCCGTTPEHIKKAVAQVKEHNLKPVPPLCKAISAVSSARGVALLDPENHFNIIGERINPTGKKKLQAELKAQKFDEVRRFAIEQKKDGATLLDVNMGMNGIDEKEMMLKTISLLSTISDLPLVIDSSDPDVIEAALKLYPGRALVNSISLEKIKIEKLLPIVAKYNAMFILLPLSDETIPKVADGRKEIVKKVFNEAAKYDFQKEDILVDGLVMTVSSDGEAANETLKFLNWVRYEFQTGSTVGLSNISFGLPQRKWVNSTFLALAIANGLSTAIANPSEELTRNTVFSARVLTNQDPSCLDYINHFQNTPSAATSVSHSETDPIQGAFRAVVEGNKDSVSSHIDTLLKENFPASKIVAESLIPAINHVGDLYDTKKYFLPQLIASAETMKFAFSILEPLLREKSNESKPLATIILATVKGDIHDIGKNIVALIFKNYGFNVIDLGKDVPASTIVEKAIENKADIIGLSALMTTTMTEMKTVVLEAKSQNCTAKIIIGGAVTTQSYAEEIGADGHAADSINAVKLVKKLLAIS